MFFFSFQNVCLRKEYGDGEEFGDEGSTKAMALNLILL